MNFHYHKILALVIALFGVETVQATTLLGEDYAVNFDKSNTLVTRTDRTLTYYTIAVAGGRTRRFSVPSSSPTTVYANLTENKVFATQGQKITPNVTYTTDAPMHGYFYIDYNQDGVFSVDLNSDHTPSATSELVSFSYYNGYNSAGVATTADASTKINFPSFTIPSGLPQGVYRARLKIDWDSTDPAGRYDGVANIDDNGGKIIDFLLCIGEVEQPLTVDTRNGNVYSSTSTALPTIVRSGQGLSIKATPVAQGYVLDTLYIQHGFNLNGPASIRGNQQWSMDTIPAAKLPASLTYTIPGNKVDGEVRIRAYFHDDNASYKLVWSDEFNTEGRTKADSQKWRSSIRRKSTWNRFITDSIDVAFVENGQLVLRAIPNLDQTADPVDFLTGSMESRGKFSFLHGKIEARALTNPFVGNFPAIWMMPADQSDGWPKCGEIDIFEQINTENISYHTVHSHWTFTLGNKTNPRSSYTKSIDMKTYHTYGLEWTSDTLIWFVDGREVGRYNRVPENEASGQWPFEKPFYIILNQSVGDGSWARKPVAGHTYETKIDWVRVYQKDVVKGVQSFSAEATKLQVATSAGLLSLSTTQPMTVHVHDLMGRVYFNGQVNETHSIALPRGWYILNKQKVWIP